MKRMPLLDLSVWWVGVASLVSAIAMLVTSGIFLQSPLHVREADELAAAVEQSESHHTHEAGDLFDYEAAVHAHSQPRDPGWSTFRKHNIGPECVACGRTTQLTLHHKIPVHTKEGKRRELDPNNVITLCQLHHFDLGHLGHWDWWNAHVEEDAKAYRRRVIARGK